MPSWQLDRRGVRIMWTVLYSSLGGPRRGLQLLLLLDSVVVSLILGGKDTVMLPRVDRKYEVGICMNLCRETACVSSERVGGGGGGGLCMNAIKKCLFKHAKRPTMTMMGAFSAHQRKMSLLSRVVEYLRAHIY